MIVTQAYQPRLSLFLSNRLGIPAAKVESCKSVQLSNQNKINGYTGDSPLSRGLVHFLFLTVKLSHQNGPLVSQ